MRLTIDATNIGPGGGITGFGYYLKQWVRMGEPEEIIIWASRPKVIEVAESVGGQIKVEPFMVGQSSAKVFLASQFKLSKIIEKARPDVLMTTLRMLHGCKVPQLVHHRNLLWQTRDTFWNTVRSKGLKFAIYAQKTKYEYYYALKHSAANAYISKYMCELASRQYPESEARNYPVCNGGLQSPFSDDEKAKRISMDRPATIIAVQSDGEHKQSDKLLYMMRHLVDKAPKVEWKLVIAGTIYNEPAFDALAEELGVANFIQKPGYLKQQQIYGLFDEALCHVFPSKFEGFGNSPLEAMAMGCPVVASDCTAIPEVVGKAGILVPPSEPKAFANGVLTLHDNMDIRGEYIERGFEQIKNFSWEKSALKMLELFKKISSSKVQDNS